MLIFLFALIEIPVLLAIIIISKLGKEIKVSRARKSFSGKSAELFESAKKIGATGEYKAALAQIRNSLEALVKYMGQRYGLPFNAGAYSLLDMIDGLYQINAINAEQKDLMHSLRIVCNRGSHVEINEERVDSREVFRAISKMDDLIASLRTTHGTIFPEMFAGEGQTRKNSRL